MPNFPYLWLVDNGEGGLVVDELPLEDLRQAQADLHVVHEEEVGTVLLVVVGDEGPDYQQQLLGGDVTGHLVVVVWCGVEGGAASSAPYF